MRQRIENYLRRNASVFISAAPVSAAALLLMVGCTTIAAAIIAAPILTIATAAPIAIVVVIAMMYLTSFLVTVARRALIPFIIALYISAGSWAGLQVFDGGAATGAENNSLGRVIILFVLFGLGTFITTVFIAASIQTASQRVFYCRGRLDNYLLAFLQGPMV
jgi:hypothetical protein